MSKSISLTIQMDDPCYENWGDMEPTAQGRFCATCQKPVVDFTGLTDQQILQYFLEHPFPVCGRMLHAQKDHTIEHAPLQINRHLSPVAATLLTLATISSEAAAPAPVPVSLLQTPLSGNQQKPAVTANTVSISGTVKDEHGKAIENAEIIFGEYKVMSDKNGNFQFTLETASNKPGIIQFSYGNLIREVRNYHPLMGSTSFDITLFARHGPVYLFMGIAKPNFHLPDSLSKFPFSSSNKLDVKTRALLSELATFMRNEPVTVIVLKSYYNTPKQKANKLSDLIKNYLESEEGISSERIQLGKPEWRKEKRSEVVIECKEWAE